MEALRAILGHLGEKLSYLGRSWRQVGTLLAACWDKDGEDEPREANLGGKWVALGNEGWCDTRVLEAFERASGGCLELESRKVLLGSVTPVARGRRISSALRAPSRHRAEPAAGN